MRIRTPFAAIAISAVMLTSGAPSSNAAPPAPLLKVDAQTQLVQTVKHRRHESRSHKRSVKRSRSARRIYLPIAPNYSAFDYPYYYARGHYPTHIAPGYMYYARPYAFYGNPYAYSTYPYFASPYPYAAFRHRGYIRHGGRAWGY